MPDGSLDATTIGTIVGGLIVAWEGVKKGAHVGYRRIHEAREQAEREAKGLPASKGATPADVLDKLQALDKRLDDIEVAIRSQMDVARERREAIEHKLDQTQERLLTTTREVTELVVTSRGVIDQNTRTNQELADVIRSIPGVD